MRAHECLEKEWAEWNGLPPSGMVVCSSGTAALHLALEALPMPRDPATQVILPDFTMIACARAITMSGHVPMPVDVTRTGLLDPDLVDDALDHRQSKGCAIMAVHTYGRQCDTDSLQALAMKYGAFMVEDLAEAHGICPHPFADAACWSFYSNKVIAGEEGGAVYFRNPAHADHARQLRNLGFTAAHDFMHVPRGCNYRLADALASLILQSIGDYDTNIEERRRLCAWYSIACPADWRMPPRAIPWVYDFLLPSALGDPPQDAVVGAMREAGIEARHGFKRLTSQPEYAVRGKGLTVAADLSRRLVYLPLTPGAGTTEGDCMRVFQLVRHVVAGA